MSRRKSVNNPEAVHGKSEKIIVSQNRCVDFMRFVEVLFKGNLLKPETLELLKGSVPIPDGMIGWDGFSGYGLGLNFISMPYEVTMGYEGDLFGASSFMFYFPEQDVIVVRL